MHDECSNQPNNERCLKCREETNKANKIDPVVESVRADLLQRSIVGVNKYGTTLADNQGDLRYWLQHAYEETLDHANYLKRAIMEIDKLATERIVYLNALLKKGVITNKQYSHGLWLLNKNESLLREPITAKTPTQEEIIKGAETLKALRGD